MLDVNTIGNVETVVINALDQTTQQIPMFLTAKTQLGVPGKQFHTYQNMPPLKSAHQTVHIPINMTSIELQITEMKMKMKKLITIVSDLLFSTH